MISYIDIQFVKNLISNINISDIIIYVYILFNFTHASLCMPNPKDMPWKVCVSLPVTRKIRSLDQKKIGLIIMSEETKKE